MKARILLLSALSGCLAPSLVQAQELEKVSPGGGRFDVGGYAELQLRGLSDGFDANNFGYDGAIDRPPGVDIEITGRAIQPFGAGNDKIHEYRRFAGL